MLDSLHDEPLPLRRAIEDRDREAVSAALSEDVRFMTPAVEEPYLGRENVAKVFCRVVFDIFEDFRYVGELREGGDEVLRFRTRIGDTEIEGVDLVRYGPDGLITELTVIFRPAAAFEALRRAYGARMPRTEAS